MADDNHDERIKALEAELKRAREEAAERRVKLREYEEAEEKRKSERARRDEEEAKKKGEYEKLLAEQKSEFEKFKRSQAQKEAAARKQLLNSAIRAHLADLADPDFVKLFDTDGIEIDADSYEIRGLEDRVKSFRESKPHLFKAADPNPNPPAPPKPGPPPQPKNPPPATDWSALKGDEFNAKLRSEFGI